MHTTTDAPQVEHGIHLLQRNGDAVVCKVDVVVDELPPPLARLFCSLLIGCFDYFVVSHHTSIHVCTCVFVYTRSGSAYRLERSAASKPTPHPHI